METKWLVLFLVCLSLSPLCFSESSPTSDEQNGDIDWWCNRTPHPEPCRYYMGHDPKQFKPKCRDEFRTMTVLVALEQVYGSQKHAKNLKYQCHNKRKKAVWKDCNQLLSNTVLQLKSSIASFQANETTDFDAQTWLSTALTNLEICRTGSRELNVTQFISPLVSNNVSQLISNALAVNGALMDQQNYTDGFPSWVTPVERKLLQSASLSTKANVVVAHDGSGQFKSIQAAINYATSKRVGNGRVVIYVKKGVYKENIAISAAMNKVMLIGDGLRYTIITDRRSVAGGYTTYSSATLGKYCTNLFLLFLLLFHLVHLRTVIEACLPNCPCTLWSTILSS